MNKNYVILVDSSDNEVGTEEKLEAHKNGLRHRAFSIFVFNKEKKVLIQKRALSKYHSGGLWSNTCCGHPSPNEPVLDAAHRRLKEEMGFDCNLKQAFSFSYEAKLNNGLIENEFDHVIFGFYDGGVKINPEEASEYKWVSLDFLFEDVRKNPNNYTPWLPKALGFFKKYHPDLGPFLL